MRVHNILIVCFFSVLILLSCKKEELLTSGGQIRFSTDTLTFDTVFTQLGSFTLGLKIFNTQDQKINLSSVRLQNGNSSFFRLNVNGISGNNIPDVELAANDSVYVFATVKIDPNNDTIPFVIEDKLIATLNGKEFSIPFIAYGQNAFYFVDTVISQNLDWYKGKPIVIMKNALVDKNVTLTIHEGTRVYVHADSRLFVEGTLKVKGTKTDSVVFQGDRLDRDYFGKFCCPGEWGGIYFTSNSKDNELNWTVIKNAGNSTRLGNSSFYPAAIQLNGDSLSTGTQLRITNTIIQNSIGYGILSFTGSLKMQNCLIHDCGAQALAIVQGGKYEIDNCNFINYAPKFVSHINEPTVAVLNYFEISNTQYVVGNLIASFRNCLIYGTLENEFFANKKDEALYNVTIDHCLIKTKDIPPAFVINSASQFNQDPLFEDHTKLNFRVKDGSPLIDAGTEISLNPLTTDLDGESRIKGATIDVGCYEK